MSSFNVFYLRNTSSFNEDGSYISTGAVLTVQENGIQMWKQDLNLNDISANTLDVLSSLNVVSSITTDTLAANSITFSTLNGDAITSNSVSASTITAQQIASTITFQNGLILNGLSSLNDNSVHFLKIDANNNLVYNTNPIVGTKGDQGEMGAQGPQGAQGDQGATGAQGDQGAQGPQGIQGVMGPTGLHGAQGATGAQGIQGIQGDQGIQGIQGDQGPTGPQGIRGLQGTQGDTGAQGDQGIQGIQGDQGVTGPQGIRGIQGPQGAQGIQGVDGATGTQGVQGIQGIDGATGAQGIQGLQGARGLQGIQGEMGPTGAQGIQGIQGIQGVMGPTGDQGIQGVQGVTGTQGAQGIQGVDGPTGAQGIQGSQGPQGIQGVAGAQGIQGPTGLQGPQGLKGDQGYTGDQGSAGKGFAVFATIDNTVNDADAIVLLQGLTVTTDNIGQFVLQTGGKLWLYNGANSFSYVGDVTDETKLMGATGPQGIQGIQGFTGAQGAQGIQGIQGAQGAQGVQGDQGPTGAQGVQGDQGATGIQGLMGLQGVQGDQGHTGAQGIQGAQGVTGAVGPQGIQGIQGTQGPIGAQGPQGVAGAQGIAGPTGSKGTTLWSESGTFLTTASTTNVGIGVTNPTSSWNGGTIPNAKLTILTGTPGSDGGTSRISIGGDNEHYSAIEGIHTGGGFTSLSFMTCGAPGNPTTRMTILGNGNVGIGVTNPAMRLEVYGPTGYDDTNNINFQCQASQFGRNQLYMTGRYEGGNDAWDFTTPRNGIIFRTQSALNSAYTQRWTIQNFADNLGFLSAGQGNSPVMVMANGGNVGIGETAPRQKLDVAGNIVTDWGDRLIGTQFIDASEYFLGIRTFVAARLIDISSKASDASGAVTISTGVAPTERMRVTSGGNVGIGTNNPSALLHVNGTAVNADVSRQAMTYYTRPATASVQNGVSAALFLGPNVASIDPYGSLDFRCNGLPGGGNNFGLTPDVTVMSIIGNGNVGIGVTNPAMRLEVYGPTGFDSTNHVNFQCQASQFGRNQLYMTGRYEGANDAWAFSSPRNGIIFRTQSALNSAYTERWTIQNFADNLGFLSAGQNDNPVMVMANGGNVGIGITHPAYKLDIQGGSLRIGNTIFDGSYNGTATFGGGLSLDANGNLGIGTSAQNTLHVFKLNTNHGINIDASPLYQSILSFRKNGQQHASIYLSARNNSLAYDLIFYENYLNTVAFTIGFGGSIRFNNLTTNGTLITTNSNGSVSVSSDRRIKENIVYQTDTQKALASVMNLKPATYSLIKTGGNYLGFIAQDVEQEIPLAVDGKKYEWQWETNEDSTPKFDADGNIVYKLDPNGNRIIRPRGLDDRAMIATQTLAIQELVKRETSLTEMVSNQATTISTLVAEKQALSNKLDSLIAWASAQGYNSSA